MFQQDRRETRFVYITNLIDPSSSSGNAALTNWKDDPLSVVEAVRSIVTPYDSSGMGVEVFVPHTNKKKPKGGKGDVTGQSCHVGMRTNTDAQALIAGLMKKQRVEWTWTDACGAYHTSLSGRLFVDYAVTADSPKQRRRQQGKRGEPTRPQCTSTTDHVHVPGLVLVPDFVSVAEEEALMAVLTGPRAPWAPSQKTASHPDEAVKRAVQHYGYVFDYETANVLRDRTQPGADCPPMPALSATLPNTDNGDGVPGHEKCTLGSIRNLDSFVNKCVDDGRGWEVFAGIVERTRRYEFRIDDGSSCVKFPRLNQLTVNQYLPGEGIGSHVDTPSAFGDGLISISLNGGIVMEFRKVDGDEGNDEAPDETKKLVYLPPRSLLLMSKAARYQWEHMIVGRRTDTHNGAVLPRHLRVSLTLRTALDVDGEPLPLIKSSRFPPTWGGVSSNTSPLVTPDCERDHVHAVYDAIATQWHHTRGRRGVLWPGATSFLQRLRPGSIVADVGCGDGKYFPAIWEAGSYVIGTDISEPLLRTTTSSGSNGPNAGKIPDARKLSEHRHHLSDRPAVAVADCLNVPIRSSSCDAAICIAVLHHLSTRSRRKRCIEELARIVKSGGLVNVQAWAMEQEEGSRHRFAADDVFVPFNAQPKYLDVSVSSSDSQAVNGTNVSVHRVDGKSVAQIYSEAFNADYDDEKGLVVFKRYCHLYREGELDEIALQVPGVELIESGFESGNYFITFMVRK
jgi:alkylated DNA repair protein alkB family protein 8